MRRIWRALSSGAWLWPLASCGGAPESGAPRTPTVVASASPPSFVSAAPALDLAPVDVQLIATGIGRAWAVDGAILTLDEEPTKPRRIQRLVKDKLVDAALLSRGLPAVKLGTGMSGDEYPDTIEGIIGRYPDALELGVSTTTGFGHTSLYRYSSASGWKAEPEPANLDDNQFAFVVDPAFSFGVGALFARVNQVGDGAISPNYAFFPDPTAPDLFAKAIPVRHSFDANVGGAFVEAPHTLWTLTDDSETERGIVRKDDVVIPQKITDSPGAWLTWPLVVKKNGDLLAGLRFPGESDMVAAHLAQCSGGVCHRLPDPPERVLEIRAFDSSILAIGGSCCVYSTGHLHEFTGTGWKELALPSSARAEHFLTLEENRSLLVLGDGAIIRLTATPKR